MEGKTKLAVDVRVSIKDKLKDLAHEQRATMTNIIEQLIEAAHEAAQKK